MLAALARAAGHAPVVVDLFGDADTRALAADYVAVPPCREFEFSAGALRTALAAVRARHGALPVVCGSGFERTGALLAHIARWHPLLGSDASVYAQLADPPGLLRRLARAPGVIVPATRRAPPRVIAGWLAKRRAGSGGLHVRTAGMRTRRDEYFQRHVPGRSVSALYLANGRAIRLCGMAEHLTWHGGDAHPRWRYEGARACTRVPRGWSRDARAAGRAVFGALGLRGVFGLDFIARADDRLVLVDINPRPPATLELHAARGALFEAHLRACRDGQLLYSKPRRAACRAHLLLYADADATIPADLRWPAWVSDRPVAGARVARGAPLCTLQAEAATTERVMTLLARRYRTLSSTLCARAGPLLPATSTLRTRGGSDHG